MLDPHQMQAAMGVLLVFMFLVNALWRPVAAVGFFLLVAETTLPTAPALPRSVAMKLFL